MVQLYVTLIRKGFRALEDVPQRWRADVERIISAG